MGTINLQLDLCYYSVADSEKPTVEGLPFSYRRVSSCRRPAATECLRSDLEWKWHVTEMSEKATDVSHISELPCVGINGS